MSVQTEFLMRPSTLDDIESVVDLLNDVLEYQVGARTYTVDNLRSDWESPDFDLENSVRLFINEAGDLIGEASVWDTDTVPVNVWVGLHLHPDHVDAALFKRMLAWAEPRARQAIARVPDHALVRMVTGAHRKETAKQDLLTAAGFKHIRSFYTMRIDMGTAPPAPRLPEGIRIRRFEREQDLQPAMAVLQEAFRDHWGFVDQPLEDEIKHWTHWMDSSDDYDPSLWFLAVEGDDVVGLSFCSPNASDDPDAGYVMELAVLRPWRQRGIATALLHHSFGTFWQRDVRAVMLGVDAQSLTGATRLYEKVGMHIAHEWWAYHKELRPGEELSTQSLD